MVRFVPAFVRVSVHLPAATVPVQVSEPPLMVTSTLPVGVTPPATVGTTVKKTSNATPGVDGSGVSCVIVVVVSFLTPLSVQGENAVTPLSSTQLFAVSELVLPCRDQPAPPCRQRPRLASELPFNSGSR